MVDEWRAASGSGAAVFRVAVMAAPFRTHFGADAGS
jgi:hypothetical protein